MMAIHWHRQVRTYEEKIKKQQQKSKEWNSVQNKSYVVRLVFCDRLIQFECACHWIGIVLYRKQRAIYKYPVYITSIHGKRYRLHHDIWVEKKTHNECYSDLVASKSIFHFFFFLWKHVQHTLWPVWVMDCYWDFLFDHRIFVKCSLPPWIIFIKICFSFVLNQYDILHNGQIKFSSVKQKKKI